MNNNNLNLEELSDDDLALLAIQLLSEMNAMEVHAAAAIAEQTRNINYQTQVILNCAIEYNATVHAFDQYILNINDMRLFLNLTNPTHLQCRVTYPRLESNNGFLDLWPPKPY
ncbi:hypothetical protein INT47_007866 [Mucor saturninus]|uniref:Uncharacterized protein n=1 Tax=Mucor saturninus TaxID=64648 RepID=A0A8H7REH7_9FUNG|nr:hypothetical protein INT47_007866 [Mucor saturninus]